MPNPTWDDTEAVPTWNETVDAPTWSDTVDDPERAVALPATMDATIGGMRDFARLTPSPELPNDPVEPAVGTLRGLGASLERGIKTAGGIPEAVALAMSPDTRPSMRQERAGFEQAMSDPEYIDRLTSADDPATVEALYGPGRRVKQMAAPAEASREALVQDVAKRQEEIADLPKSEAQQRMSQARTEGEKWSAWLKDPFELTASIALESLPPSIAGGVVGSLGGPMGTVAGVAGSSGLATFASELLGNAGIDTTDPKALAAWVESPEFDKAVDQALTKAGAVGAIDAATAGTAGQFVGPALKQGLKAVVKGSAKELGVQAAGGALGEGAGSVLAGQEVSPFDMAMEAAGEAVGTPTEMTGNVRQMMKERKQSIPQLPKELTKVIISAEEMGLHRTARQLAKFPQAGPAVPSGNLPTQMPEEVRQPEAVEAPKPAPAKAPAKVADYFLDENPEQVPVAPQAETVRLYQGQEGGSGGGSYWTRDQKRARSYGSNVSYVDVPADVAAAAEAARQQAGSGTSGDAILPPEWANKAKPVEAPVEQMVFDLDQEPDTKEKPTSISYKTGVQELDELTEKWRKQGVRLDLKSSDSAITLDLIDVPEGSRGKGIGSKILTELKATADKLGKPIDLITMPSVTAEGVNLGDQQSKFYERNGFTRVDRGPRKAPGYRYEPQVKESPKIGQTMPGLGKHKVEPPAELRSLLDELGVTYAGSTEFNGKGIHRGELNDSAAGVSWKLSDTPEQVREKIMAKRAEFAADGGNHAQKIQRLTGVDPKVAQEMGGARFAEQVAQDILKLEPDQQAIAREKLEALQAEITKEQEAATQRATDDSLPESEQLKAAEELSAISTRGNYVKSALDVLRGRETTGEQVAKVIPESYGSKYVREQGVDGAMKRITHLRNKIEEANKARDFNYAQSLSEESDNIGRALLKADPAYDWVTNTIKAKSPQDAPPSKSAPSTLPTTETPQGEAAAGQAEAKTAEGMTLEQARKKLPVGFDPNSAKIVNGELIAREKPEYGGQTMRVNLRKAESSRFVNIKPEDAKLDKRKPDQIRQSIKQKLARLKEIEQKGLSPNDPAIDLHGGDAKAAAEFSMDLLGNQIAYENALLDLKEPTAAPWIRGPITYEAEEGQATPEAKPEASAAPRKARVEVMTEDGEYRYKIIIPKELIGDRKYRRIGSIQTFSLPQTPEGDYILDTGFARSAKVALERMQHRMDAKQADIVSGARSHEEYQAELKAHEAFASPIRSAVLEVMRPLVNAPKETAIKDLQAMGTPAIWLDDQVITPNGKHTVDDKGHLKRDSDLSKTGFDRNLMQLGKWLETGERKGELWGANKAALDRAAELRAEQAEVERKAAEQNAAEQAEAEKVRVQRDEYNAEVAATELPKGKKQMVSVPMTTASGGLGPRQNVEMTVRGMIGIRKRENTSAKSKSKYTLTHVPTGLSLGNSMDIGSVAQAKEMIQALLHTGVDLTKGKDARPGDNIFTNEELRKLIQALQGQLTETDTAPTWWLEEKGYVEKPQPAPAKKAKAKKEKAAKAGAPTPTPQPAAEPTPAESVTSGALGEQGMGGAKPGEFAPSGQTATSIRNAQIEKENAEMGNPPIIEALRRTWGEAFDMAMAQLDKDPGLIDKLIAELESNPRPLFDWETALLAYRRADMRNEYAKATRDLAQAHDDGRTDEVEVHKARVQQLSDAIYEFGNLTRKVGSEQGRGLAARKLMVDETLSLADMEMELRAANGGAPITDSERAELKRLHDEIAAKQKAFEERVAKQEAEFAERESKLKHQEMLKQDLPSPYILKVAEKIVAKLDERADAARKRLRERMSHTSSGVDPTIIADLVEIGASHLGHVGLDFAKWSARMVQDLGDWVQPHLEEVFKRSQSSVDDITKDQPAAVKKTIQRTKDSVDDIKGKIGAKIEAKKKTEIGALVQRLARELVAAGVRDRDELIDQIHDVLKDFDPEITRREAMDAISGYGDFKPLTKDEVSVALRDLKGQMQQVGKLQDMAEGRAPQKTGVERRTPSDEERRLIKQVEEAKRKGGYRVTDPATQLKSALASIKTRLRNEISDLEHQINARKKIVKERRPIEYDAEAKALKEQRDALKAQFDEVFGQPGLTDEQRVKIAMGAVERSIAEYERRIKNREAAAPKRVSKTPETPELVAARARRDALREEWNELRDQLNPKKTPEERALQALKARLAREIAKFEDRMAAGDFSPLKSPPKKVELDADAARLKAQHTLAKEKYYKMLAKAQYAAKSRAAKIYIGAKEALNLSRAILTSWDVSAVFRQGGFITLGNPGRAARSLGAMFRAYSSKERAQVENERILSRANAPLYAQSKLFLAPLETDRLTAMEEAFMSRLASKIPGVSASQRAYVTFLNKLRADSFDAMIQNLGRNGRVTPEEAAAIANYINVSTGRGNMGKAAAAAETLATAFFAPRLVVSRFQMLFGQPLYHGSWRTRRAIAAEYAKFLAGLGVVYALGSMAGGDVEEDPRSSDFGKIRFGETRVDPLAGLAQTSVLLSRLASGESKSLRGRVESIRGDVKYGHADSADVIARFLRSKLSPAIGSAVDVASGSNIVGEEVTPGSAAINAAIPLSFRDIFAVMKEHGIPAGTALGLLSLFGMGVQHYEDR
jgi:hypothetical protein